MSLPWFKFYGQDFLTDMKISQLSPTERLMWVTLLCLAHSEGKGGYISYCNEELLKMKMGLQEGDREWEELNGFFDLFEKLDMIEKTDNGIFLKNFGKRQEMQFTSAEKQSRYREKKRKVTNVTEDKVTNVTVDEIRSDEIREENKNTVHDIEKKINLKNKTDNKNSLLPLSELQLWKIAGEKNVSLEKVKQIHESILEDVSGRNKYEIKSVLMTLYRWIKYQKDRSQLQEMNELERLEWEVSNPEVVAKDRANTKLLVERGIL